MDDLGHFKLTTVENNEDVLARLTFFNNLGVPVTTNNFAALYCLPEALVTQS